MNATSIIALLAAGFVVIGCGSSPERAAQPRSRPDVMDLDDTPPAPIPAAAGAAPIEAAPTAPVTPPAQRTHVVAAKDTLYALSKTYYGEAKFWPRIVEANPGLVPERMPVGKTIVIP